MVLWLFHLIQKQGIKSDTPKSEYLNFIVGNMNFLYYLLYLISRTFTNCFYSILDFSASDMEILFIFFLLNSFDSSKVKYIMMKPIRI